MRLVFEVIVDAGYADLLRGSQKGVSIVAAGGIEQGRRVGEIVTALVAAGQDSSINPAAEALAMAPSGGGPRAARVEE